MWGVTRGFKGLLIKTIWGISGCPLAFECIRDAGSREWRSAIRAGSCRSAYQSIFRAHHPWMRLHNGFGSENSSRLTEKEHPEGLVPAGKSGLADAWLKVNSVTSDMSISRPGTSIDLPVPASMCRSVDQYLSTASSGSSALRCVSCHACHLRRYHLYLVPLQSSLHFSSFQGRSKVPSSPDPPACV